MIRFASYQSLLLSVAALLSTECLPQQTIDPVSNCPYRPDQRWLEQGYTTQLREPNACPVYTIDVATDTRPIPVKSYRVDVWDVQNKAYFAQPVYTDFKDARGFFRGNASTSFLGFNIGQPSGKLAAMILGSYYPGEAGFTIPTAKADTAVNYTFVNANPSLRANVVVALPYLKEAAPYVSGPTSVEHGGSANYGAVAQQMRQSPSFQWYRNGQAVPGATSPSYNATFNSAGTHHIQVRATSAIGTVLWKSKYVEVELAPQCDDGGGGGGGIELAIACPGQ